MSDQENKYVQLPRARMGGLQKGPVEDLLRRIARDFAQLESENKRLWATLEGFGEATDLVPAGNGNGNEAAGQALEAVRPAAAGNGAVAKVVVQPAPSWAHPPSPEWRQETDGLATAVLALAQQAADELRESTRQECELMIKKARDRAERLEDDLERSRVRTAGELAELQALRYELREHMRSSLEALLRTFLAERSGELPALSWHDPSALLGVPEQTGSRKKRKKNKS